MTFWKSELELYFSKHRERIISGSLEPNPQMDMFCVCPKLIHGLTLLKGTKTMRGGHKYVLTEPREASSGHDS